MTTPTHDALHTPAPSTRWEKRIVAVADSPTSTFARRHAGIAVLGAFVVAVVLHTLWDSQTSLIGTAVVALASLGILTFTAPRPA